MEQAKKNLKTFSIFVLLYAGASLIKILTELLLGDLNSAEIPVGSPDNILMITKMVLLGISLILLLPRVYVGCKGLKIAKKPDASKGHIIWAMIIVACLALELILDLPAMYYIDMLKNIHSTEVEDGILPDMKETALSWADFVSAHIPEEQSKKLRALIEAVPKQNTLMHGDYHTNNIMVQNGEPLLIDMDTLCMGHPVFELGSMFNAFVGFSELDHQNIMNFMGYNFETAGKFWNMALKMYLGTEDEAVCQSVAEKAMIIGYTRMLRRAIRRPNDPDSSAKIARCKEMLEQLLSKVDTLTF